MKFNKLFINTALALTISAGAVSAQGEADAADSSSSMFPPFMQKMYVGAGVGSAIAYTDIKQYPTGMPVFTNRNELGFGVNGLVGYKFNRWFSVEGSLTWTRLNGTKRQVSGLPWGEWFTASVLQWDLGYRLNLLNLFSKKTQDTRKFDLYLVSGIGLTAFRTSRHQLINATDEDPIMAVEGYHSLNLEDKARKTMAGALNGGLVASYRINSNLDLFLDLRFWSTNTDELDASNSVNSTMDKYNYNALGVIYHFGGAKSVGKPVSDKDEALNEILEKFKDTDGDGVADYQDKDNSTPAGVKVYADGTAIDTDGDGIADYLDKEKVSPCKEVDANGVAKDSDKDGVADCNDLEPNTESGNQVDSKGRTIKTGPVGVAPAAPAAGKGGGSGSTASSGVISGLPSVFFASNSKSIDYKNYPAMTQVAQFLKANPTAKLIVVGNTDKVGSEDYNNALALKRAQAVVDHLVKNNGIEASRLSVVSKGSSATISTKRNAYQDRRVDFLLAQ